jgi:hypothetical protein
MISLARGLILLGLILMVVGGTIYLLTRLGIPIGQLPGDIRIQGENVSCLIPLATSIVLSIILTLLFNLVIRIFNK